MMGEGKTKLLARVAKAERERDNAEADLQILRSRVSDWDDHIRELLGPLSAYLFQTPTFELGGDKPAPFDVHAAADLTRILLETGHDMPERKLFVRMAITHPGEEPKTWEYFCGSNILDRGLTKFEMVSIATQVGEKFFQRMEGELARRRAEKRE